MRQRKVKNEAEKLASYPEYLPSKPEIQKGRWQDLFREKRVNDGQNRENTGRDRENTEKRQENPEESPELYLEVGCGKGKFIADMAEQNQQHNYIGIEGNGSVILRALEKGEDKQLPNLVFIYTYIKDMETYFEEGEVSGIYLNFSDPWPKDRHGKRRLTHRNYLEGYLKILKRDSFIAFKTDNSTLFDFALEEFQAMNMNILECTRDLHGSNLSARLMTTEYEEKFMAAGKAVHYCKVKP